MGPDQTSRAYFAAVLTNLHLPVTDENLHALYSVEHFEGDNDRYNPLNVVQPEPGSSSYNGVGVQTYADFATGVAGTSTLLTNSHWIGVRAALAPGNSATAVMSAFSAAYTWTSGTNFPATEAIWAGEAIRDVGGTYSDNAMARQRAASVLDPLNSHVDAAMCSIAAARARSNAAHSDWTRLSTVYAEQHAAYLRSQNAGTSDQLAVDGARAYVMATIVNAYQHAPGSTTMQALTAHNPNEVLLRASLLTYVHTHDIAVLKSFAAQSARAKSELAAAATALAAATDAHNQMIADQAAWMDAERSVTTGRAALTSYLRTHLASSLTHDVAVADLLALTTA